MRIFLFLASILFSVLLVGCGSTPKQLQADLQTSPSYITQVGMWADKGVNIFGTNYATGTHIPVNTEITVKKVSDKEVHFTVPSMGEQTFKLLNNAHTGVTIDGLFMRTFDRKPVNLANFSDQQTIKNGKIKVGMTRDEVIAARGYPPSHKTPDLKANEWRYWESKFNTTVIRFGNDGKIAEIID